MVEINMQKYSKDKLLLGLAARLEDDPKFMANILHKYQGQEKLSRDEVIRKFDISQGQFAQLALCKRPDAEAEDFAAQVRNIASVVGVNASIIVEIIRQVDSLEALSHQPTSQETTVSDRQVISYQGALAAARDRDTNGETDEDSTENNDLSSEESAK